MELNRAEYVSFLRNLTNNPTTLPRFTPHRCCDAQDLEVSWEQGRDRTQATARCKTCMNRRPVKSIALMRTDLLQREYDLNLFTPELYSLPTWKGKRFRIDLTKLRKNTHQW
ncbi:hypothetical protein F7U66_00355 [Vibrio parahaemolyticus]|nr:hypothetical protein [Vibrio parahaemolyticus]